MYFVLAFRAPVLTLFLTLLVFAHLVLALAPNAGDGRGSAEHACQQHFLAPVVHADSHPLLQVSSSVYSPSQNSQSSLLIFDWAPSRIVSSNVVALLKDAGARACFFLSASAICDDTEPLLRELLGHGHTIVLASEATDDEHFEVIIRREEAAFESATGRGIYFIDSVLYNRSASLGLFLLPRPTKAVSNQLALDLLSKRDASQLHIARIEHFLTDAQLHCLYDRMLCDLTARGEIYFALCQDVRAEYFARRDIDLFKFAPISFSLWTDVHTTSDEDDPPPQYVPRFVSTRALSRPQEERQRGGFVQDNRLRVNIAYDHLVANTRTAAPIKEVMYTLYTLSNFQIQAVSNRTITLSDVLRTSGATSAYETDVLFSEPEDDSTQNRRYWLLLPAVALLAHGVHGLRWVWAAREIARSSLPQIMKPRGSRRDLRLACLKARVRSSLLDRVADFSKAV